MNTNTNSNHRNATQAPKASEIRRREASEDLKNLALLSFDDKTGLTPLDTLFDTTTEATKTDAKIRHVI